MSNNINISEYKDFLQELKHKIQHAQVRAITKVNQEMLLLYWELGKMILERQAKSNWGDKVLKQISKDIKKDNPKLKGFSERNLKFMRQFAQEYPQFSIGKQAVSQISWGHNIRLMQKVKDPEKRLWYAQAAIEYGWSRNVMLMQIESKLYERQGKAITNFKNTLPSPQSDMAEQALKDPYLFDFVTLASGAHERNIEDQLVVHITKFLLELGKGFAFVGQQYHLPVGDNDYYIDLLFYNFNTNCFVVIDLKTRKFKPEYAGKMNFYINVVDDILKRQSDAPTIGIILCKDDKGKIADIEYALRGIDKPIGVSDFKITETIPDDLKSSLPTIEDIEREFDQ